MENVKNSVRLSGFAGTDPVVVNFANQKKMARVSLAVHEFYRNSGGESINQTQWFNLVFWNKKVELVTQLIKKGSGLCIEGRLSTQVYIDKKGEQRYTTEIVVNSMQLTDNEARLFSVHPEG